MKVDVFFPPGGVHNINNPRLMRKLFIRSSYCLRYNQNPFSPKTYNYSFYNNCSTIQK